MSPKPSAPHIAQQRATIDEQQAVLQSMQRDMALMKRALFGQRRERFDDPRQGLLFDSVVVGEASQDDVSTEGADDDSSDETIPTTKMKTRPPRNEPDANAA